MPLRRRADARYGGDESPGQPSRERVDPGKADTAPKAAPGFRAGLAYSLPSATSRWAVVLVGGRGRGVRRALLLGTGEDAGQDFLGNQAHGHAAVHGRLLD